MLTEKECKNAIKKKKDTTVNIYIYKTKNYLTGHCMNFYCKIDLFQK